MTSGFRCGTAKPAPPKPTPTIKECPMKVGFNLGGRGSRDIPGMPLRGLKSVADCSAHCSFTPECEYFVYSENLCYLKNNLKKARYNKDAKATSGVRCKYSPGCKANSEFPCVRGCAVQTGTNFLGPNGNQDLPGMPLTNIATVDDCSARCTAEPKCEYFAYSRSKCFLKKNFSRQKNDKHATSGWRCEAHGSVCPSGFSLIEGDIPGADQFGGGYDKK